MNLLDSIVLYILAKPDLTNMHTLIILQEMNLFQEWKEITYLSSGFTTPGNSFPNDSLFILWLIYYLKWGKICKPENRTKNDFKLIIVVSQIKACQVIYIVAFCLNGHEIMCVDAWLMDAFSNREVKISSYLANIQ